MAFDKANKASYDGNQKLSPLLCLSFAETTGQDSFSNKKCAASWVQKTRLAADPPNWSKQSGWLGLL